MMVKRKKDEIPEGYVLHKGRMIEDHTEDQEEADKRRKAWEDAHRPEKPRKE